MQLEHVTNYTQVKISLPIPPFLHRQQQTLIITYYFFFNCPSQRPKCLAFFKYLGLKQRPVRM